MSWVEESDAIKTSSLFQGVKCGHLKTGWDNLDQDQLLQKDKMYKPKLLKSKNTFSKLHIENMCFGIHQRHIIDLATTRQITNKPYKHRKGCFDRGN